MKGVVIRTTGSWTQIRTGDGANINARVRGTFRIKGLDTTNPVAVGDHVEVEMTPDGTGLITKICPRKNYIIRKSAKLSKRSHIIASNIDQALLVATVSRPKTPTMFIDRFLVTAEAYHIPAIIVINKMDLYNEKDKKSARGMTVIYKRAGYQVLHTSALTGENTEKLKTILKDKVTLVTGLSGVGKSHLINKVDPGLELKVGKISEYHKAGTHTTTFAGMHPLSFGGYIIDTPGIKGFGLIDLKEELAHRFPEMRRVMAKCKFSNCSHVNEPGCAVQEAVEKGEISSTRYKNYLEILQSDEESPYR